MAKIVLVPYHQPYPMTTLPRDCHRTDLGDSQGADAQYRCLDGRWHVRKFKSRLVAHADRANPEESLPSHAVLDCQGWVILTTGLAVGGIVGLRTKDWRKATVAGLTGAAIAWVVTEGVRRDWEDRHGDSYVLKLEENGNG